MIVREITENISGIYRINFPNDKIYIGRTSNVKRRMREHYCKIDNTLCQKKLWEYFDDYLDISFDMLFVQNEYDYSEQKEQEKKYISLFHSNDPNYGYNLTFGGDGADIGVNNVASKFTLEDLNDIYTRLIIGQSNIEIASIYNVHPDTIGCINQGKRYYNKDLHYPLRTNNLSKNGLNNLNSFKKEAYFYIVEQLLTTNKSIAQISKETGYSESLIYSINSGKHFICKELKENFPLHNFGRKTTHLSEEEVLAIKKDLLNPNLSTTDIANIYKTSRDTISDINQGKRYKDEREYPIRNFYPKRGSKKPVSTIHGSVKQGHY